MPNTNHPKFDVEGYLDSASRLPFYPQQALTSSVDYVQRYLEQHTAPSTGLTNEAASMLAAARLQWILQDARRRLAGIFTLDDIVTLMNCFQSEIFFPDQIRTIPSHLCDDLGVEVDEYKSSGIAPLVDKLLALTAPLKVALADALEQAWHVGLKSDVPLEEFLEGLGLELQ